MDGEKNEYDPMFENAEFLHLNSRPHQLGGKTPINDDVFIRLCPYVFLFEQVHGVANPHLKSPIKGWVFLFRSTVATPGWLNSLFGYLFNKCRRASIGGV